MAKKKTNRKEHHVVPNKKGGWDVKINNAGHRTYHTRKKSTAVKKARAISRKHGSELVIHNSKGRIEVKNSHDVIRRGKPGPKPKKSKKKTKKAKKVVRRKGKKTTKRKVKKTKKVAKRKPAKKAKRKAKKVVRRKGKKTTKKKAKRKVKKAKRRR